MERKLSEQDARFQAEMREFFTTAIPQEIRDAQRADEPLTPEHMRTTQRIMNDAGIAVPHWPVEWGGKDWSQLQHYIWSTEMQYAAVPPPLAFNASMVGPVIATFGSQDLKERFLPATAALDIWWCQGFSEPDAGSDLAGLRTTAVRDGDHYVVHGQKTWTTLGQYADWIFMLVRTDPQAERKQQGISFLLIDMRSEGITLRPIQLIDGGHEVNEIFFDSVRVPADQLVGEENKGWGYAKFLLGNERVGIAQIGTSKRRLADLKVHAAAIDALDDPLIAARIAELEADLMALELTTIRVAGSSRDGRPDPASSILKLRGSQLQQDIIELAMDVAGPMSLDWAAKNLPAWASTATPEYLNNRKLSIFGGSNEIQRGIIAGGILGLKG